MAQPPAYERTHNFTQELGTQHGINLDEEFNDIQLTLAETNANAALIQRDDGAIANSVVTPESFSSASLALLASDFTPRGEWVIGTAYAIGDIVEVTTTGSYVAVTVHVAGAVFTTDKAAGKWVSLSGTTLAVLAASTSAALIGATVGTVQSTLDGKQPLDATLTALAALATAANKLAYFTGSDAAALADFTTVGRALAGLTNPSAVTFPRLNADNTATALSAALFATALGLGTSDSPTFAGITPAATPSTTAPGYLGTPQNTQNAAYGLVMTDAGKTIYHDETNARTWTIPANASVAFPIGTVIILDNTGNSGGAPGVITLAITTDTLRRGDGTAGTGSRTISANQVAAIRKTKATEWSISGVFS